MSVVGRAPAVFVFGVSLNVGQEREAEKARAIAEEEAAKLAREEQVRVGTQSPKAASS